MQTALTTGFNKPYQQAVAVDTRHIGDDNDYSCFLARTVYQLYISGHTDTAYILYRTDPMLTADVTTQEFMQRMEQQKQLQVQAEQQEKDSWKFYAND